MKNIAFLLLFLSAMACQTSENSVADLVLKNGVIYTVNEADEMAEAVAVANGNIVFVGTNAEVEAYIGSETQLIDLEGKIMTPGFIEGHGHFMGVGYGLMNLDLMGTMNFQAIIDLVAAEVEKRPEGEWILGHGWHQSKWDMQPAKLVKGFPVHNALSEISPNHPVVLSHASGHAIFVNAKAMEMAEILNDGSTTVDGGEIIRDERGLPTGLFNETAMSLINRLIPENSASSDQQAFELAVKECHRLGISSFHDAGIGENELKLFKEKANDGNMGVRLYAMISSGNRAFVNKVLSSKPEIGLGDDFLTVRSIKIHADGALGSRGAWLLKDYTDRPGHAGLETEPMGHVQDMAEKALQNGFQVCTHAIGDRTNQEVLDRYQIAFEKYPEVIDHRFRIEHSQHLHLNDIERFGNLGVIASIQAIHMSSDRPWAIDRLGSQRIVDGAYVWRKLIDSGALIVNGTDAPVEPLNPIPSFYAAVSRKTLSGQPDGGYEPDQKMTRKEALASYTLNGAFASFQEDILGSIEVGKLADFTVFDRDIMKVEEAEILGAKVLYTIIDGKVKYQAE